MRVLALEPFFGGSHAAFLRGWHAHSKHVFTILDLPGFNWKWRMRHAPITLANRLRSQVATNHTWDLIWCSDMLDLACFLGIADPKFRNIPSVAYFHENQLTYPSQFPDARDFHFALTNITTAISANAVWFNSDFHRDDFLTATKRLLSKMPDFRPTPEIERVREKSEVHPPGIDATAVPIRTERVPGPVRICWNSRWEFDKNPNDFFAALRRLKAEGLRFQLIVLGESFKQVPQCFAEARREFATEIRHFGYASDRQTYLRRLAEADVVVSTANHEFFGIAVMEGMAAGAVPALPTRLSYPRLLASMGLDDAELTYDGTIEGLVQTLRRHAVSVQDERFLKIGRRVQRACHAFDWKIRAAELDTAADRVLEDTLE